MPTSFEMFTKITTTCFDEFRRENNKANSQFIMKVREEDRRDKILSDVFMRSTEENPYTKQIATNIALCKAVAEENYSRQTAERRRMLRRRTNEDLRHLEYKLRAAYTSKAVAAQSFEAKQLSVEEKAKTHHENQGLQAARIQPHEHSKFRIAKTQEKKKALKSVLQAQIASKEAKHRMEQLSKMEDKKQMDEAVRQYKNEILENERALSEKKKRIKKEMDDFEALQAKWKTDRNKIDKKVQLGYEKFSSQHGESRQLLLQKKKELKDKKALISEQIGKEIHKLAEIKRKSFDFLTELLVDERNANEDMKYTRENQKKLLDKINIRNDLIAQHKLKEKQKMDEKMQEDKLHRETLLVLEERDVAQRRIEDMKRKATEDHQYALLHALNEKKRLKVKEMKRLLTVEKSEQVDLERKKMEIENSKEEIIREHAPALKEFIISKVLCEG